ncbi:MAG: hypothetical protein PVI86_19990 [Phycisphaerae bacterium]|jgi:hypothetical protein
MKTDDQVYRITGLPTPDVLARYSAAIEDAATTETDMQRFFEQNPSMLAAFEFAEFVRELRLPKRNLDDELYSSLRKARRPDVLGVRLFPLDTPIVMEMKSPNDAILDESSRTLSSKSMEAISQARSAVLHLLRSEGVERLRSYGWEISGLVAPEKLTQIDELAFSGTPNDEALTAVMCDLQDSGVAIIALLGSAKEFQGHENLRETARALFARHGVVLFAYDELLLWSEVLVDFAQSEESLHQYFRVDRAMRSVDGTLCRFPRGSLFRKSAIEELQKVIFRTADDVCIYGFGSPPPPAEKGQLKALAFFDVTKVLDPPTFLPGDEHLLWAGRCRGNWVVVKRRLTEPLKGGVVWYFFDPPIRSATVGGML